MSGRVRRLPLFQAVSRRRDLSFAVDAARSSRNDHPDSNMCNLFLRNNLLDALPFFDPGCTFHRTWQLLLEVDFRQAGGETGIGPRPIRLVRENPKREGNERLYLGWTFGSGCTGIGGSDGTGCAANSSNTL